MIKSILPMIAKHSTIAWCIGLLSAGGYAGWLKVSNLQLKSEIVEMEAGQAEGIAEAERVLRKHLEEIHKDELAELRRVADSKQETIDALERIAKTQQNARLRSERELESRRSDPDVRDWLGTVPPVDIQPWLRGETQSGREADPGAGTSAVPPRTHTPGMVRPVPGDTVSIRWDK